MTNSIKLGTPEFLKLTTSEQVAILLKKEACDEIDMTIEEEV